MTDKTPIYHSVFGNTSEMLLSNKSAWKPSWAQQDKLLNTRELSTRNKSRNNHTRTNNNSVYNGLLTAPNANVTIYCTIIESRSVSPVVGICMINPQLSKLTIIEIPDSPTFVRTINKLTVHMDSNQMHLLLPLSYQKRQSNIVKILEANVEENAEICYIPDSAFKINYDSFRLISGNVKESERESMRVELGHKKLGYAATCACLMYLREQSQNTFVHESFNVKFESCEDSMFISTSAIRDLELIESNTSKDKGKSVSFFKFLNCTLTKMGERLLKNNIRQPLTNKESIILRYEAVNELISDEGVLSDLILEMKGMIDLDNLFSVLCKKAVSNLDAVNDQMVNFVLLLKNVLITTQSVCEILKPLKSKLISEVRFTLENPDIDCALKLISEYINEDCIWVSKPVELRNQKCYAVKVGQNGILDASRQLYKSLVDDILKNIEELSENYELILENRYDKNRGFYILIKDMKLSEFENFENSPFINVFEKGKNIECTTMELMKLNLRVDSVLDEIYLMTEEAVDELVNKCRKFIPTFFLLSEAFAILDLICCFATKIINPSYNYTCPEFDGNNIAMKESRHPLLEFIYKLESKHRKVIGNDVTIVKETSRVQIITGPNMSGKSIFIKQFALNVILAQIGMFVPAEYASMKIFKSIFTRLANDTIEPNMSTFSMEMIEMADILHHADMDSLIIIDELGRGTGYNDAMAICLSMIEKIREMRSVCLFVTHFVGIPKVFQNKPGIFELHMSGGGGGGDQFKINPGVNEVTGYGIKLVEDTGLFPQEVVDCAREISDKLKLASAARMVDSEVEGKRNRQTKLILNCYEMLNHVVHNVSENELFDTLAALENEFIEKYDPLGVEGEEEVEEVEVDKCGSSDGGSGGGGGGSMDFMELLDLRY